MHHNAEIFKQPTVLIECEFLGTTYAGITEQKDNSNPESLDIV